MSNLTGDSISMLRSRNGVGIALSSIEYASGRGAHLDRDGNVAGGNGTEAALPPTVRQAAIGSQPKAELQRQTRTAAAIAIVDQPVRKSIHQRWMKHYPHFAGVGTQSPIEAANS